ncbi:MAG: hypothetical protein J0I50_07400, partial [Microbacterium sp.]|nr:hypothetical protein [Microbacterium sp.]
LIASVTGTELDPQVRSAQIKRLESAGIIVTPSNEQACELALAVINADAKVNRHANA